MKVSVRKNLENDKASVRARINAEAIELQATVMTPGVPYRLKEEEARRLLVGDLASSPMLEAEALARNMPVRRLADLILSRAELCREEVAEIEARRVSALLRLEKATSPAQIAQVKL